jgi:hypothetical protein
MALLNLNLDCSREGECYQIFFKCQENAGDFCVARAAMHEDELRCRRVIHCGVVDIPVRPEPLTLDAKLTLIRI